MTKGTTIAVRALKLIRTTHARLGLRSAHAVNAAHQAEWALNPRRKIARDFAL